MAAKKSSKSVQALTGLSGGASGGRKQKSSLFAKEAASPDHKKGKAGRVTSTKVNPVVRAQAEARKGGTPAARDTHNRSSVAASGKKGK